MTEYKFLHFSNPSPVGVKEYVVIVPRDQVEEDWARPNYTCDGMVDLIGEDLTVFPIEEVFIPEGV